MAYTLLNPGEWAAQHNGRSGRGRASGRAPARRRAAALVIPLLALVSAGCFTDPVNRKPSVMLSGPDSLPLRNQPETFHAHATDPDGDATHLKWAFQTSKCMLDDPPDASSWQVPPDESTFTVPGSATNGPFCVWVIATDAHNATDMQHLEVDPGDQPPDVKIQVVSPDPATVMAGAVAYSLYSTIELSSDGTSDPEGDVLDYTMPGWTLQRAPGSSATIKPCTQVASSTSSAPPHQCFTADVQGEYDVSLTVVDSWGMPGVAALKIFVNQDQLPCIGFTDPGFMSPMLERDPSVTQTFTVDQVIDDGSAYPNPAQKRAILNWYTSVNGRPFEFEIDWPSFTLAAGTYKIGDSVKVRLEVLDGNPNTAASLFGCDSDVCPANTGASCFQRVTWSIDFR